MDWIDQDAGDGVPINCDMGANLLRIALTAREPNLIVDARRQRAHVVANRRFRRSGLCVGLERNQGERHAEHLGDFLAEPAVFSRFVTRAPKPSADDLLAEKLRHERPKADNVRDRVAIPSFGQHPHADNAAHVATGWMKRSLQLLREFLEAFRENRPALAIGRPIALAHCVQGQPHPARFIALGRACVGFVNALGIDSNGVDHIVAIAKTVDLERRNPGGALLVGQPFVDDLGDRRVLADQDKNRQSRRSRPLPSLGFRFPKPAEHRDRRVRYFKIASGLGLARLPPRSAGVSFGKIHSQMLK